MTPFTRVQSPIKICMSPRLPGLVPRLPLDRRRVQRRDVVEAAAELTLYYQHHQQSPRGPQDLILRSRKQSGNFRTAFGRNRGRKRTPCDALIDLDKVSASGANSGPNLTRQAGSRNKIHGTSGQAGADFKSTESLTSQSHAT